MVYDAVLLVHSWLRWVVLLGAVFVLGRSVLALRRGRDWTGGDRKVAAAFVATLDLQLVLGLLLYVFLSPVTRAALGDLGTAMGSASLRFFVVEHQVAALLAVASAHVGSVRARRAGVARSGHRSIIVWIGLCLLFLVLAIPWPFLPYGRPLLLL